MNHIYERKPSVLTTKAGEGIQLTDLDDLTGIHQIDGCAQYIWLALNGDKPFLEVIQDVQTELDIASVDQSRFKEDAIHFLHRLVAKNLVITRETHDDSDR